MYSPALIFFLTDEIKATPSLQIVTLGLFIRSGNVFESVIHMSKCFIKGFDFSQDFRELSSSEYFISKNATNERISNTVYCLILIYQTFLSNLSYIKRWRKKNIDVDLFTTCSLCCFLHTGGFWIWIIWSFYTEKEAAHSWYSTCFFLTKISFQELCSCTCPQIFRVQK